LCTFRMPYPSGERSRSPMGAKDYYVSYVIA
jgi:hypothetical protein